MSNTWATFGIVAAVGIIAGTCLGFVREKLSPPTDNANNPFTRDVPYATNVDAPRGGRSGKRKSKRINKYERFQRN
jgi:hypothetical protein